MSRVLVAYASKHGATAEIAVAIAEGLTRRGVDAHSVSADSADSIESYDGFVVESAVYTGHWLKPAREFAESQARGSRQQTGLAL
jgi:menaquinone-dependent protoporphyrinogen oxidase